MTLTLHINRQRRFKWNWFGVNLSGGGWVSASARFQALIVPLVIPMWPRLPIDHDVSHTQARTLPMKLIWSESAQWLLSSSVCKFSRALTTPLGTTMWPWWASHAPRLQTKTVSMKLGYWIPASSRFDEPLLRPWLRPCRPDGQFV